MADVQMLRATGVMWACVRLPSDDISSFQKCHIYIKDMLCRSSVQPYLLKEECRPDSREWQKSSYVIIIIIINIII